MFTVWWERWTRSKYPEPKADGIAALQEKQKREGSNGRGDWGSLMKRLELKRGGFEGIPGTRNSTRKGPGRGRHVWIVVGEWQVAWGTRLEKMSLVH